MANDVGRILSKVVMIIIMNKQSYSTASKPVRMTRQRQVILEEMQPGKHPTADAVYENVRKKIPNISLGTVYRNLELLSRSGRIRRFRLGGGQKQFDGGTHRHYHVRCTSCGRVDDVSAAALGDLEQAVQGTSDFEIRGHHLEFEGLCPTCRAAAGNESDAKAG